MDDEQLLKSFGCTLPPKDVKDNMTTLVFPDLHNPTFATLNLIEDTISRDKPCHSVFLGDYFDNWGDTPKDLEGVCAWLHEHVGDKDRTYLIGNHDCSYFFPSQFTRCQGWRPDKMDVVRKSLAWRISLFKFHAWAQGWLLTHAGLTAEWLVHNDRDIKEWLEEEDEAARGVLNLGDSHWLIAVSNFRGGMDMIAGPLWCDRREFHPTKGLKQIFGHTPGTLPVWINKDNVCIDTCYKNKTHHYAVIEDGVASVHELK